MPRLDRLALASLLLPAALTGCGGQPVVEPPEGARVDAPAAYHSGNGGTTGDPDPIIVPSPVPKLPDPVGPGMSKEGELVKPTGEVQPTTPAPTPGGATTPITPPG